MILDNIKNSSLYSQLGSGIKQGLDYINNTDLEALAPGKYELPNGLIAIRADYDTKPHNECVIEAHKNYIDIQFVISGEEQMGYAPLMDQIPSTPYNAEKDVAFYSTTLSLLKFKAGTFAIYFPTDIHMPGGQYKAVSSVKKLVLKVPVKA